MTIDTTTYTNSQLTAKITADATDAGTQIGIMSATVDTRSRSLSVSVTLTGGATLPADSVIQSQLTDFIASARNAANTAGLTQFGIAE